MKKVVSVARTLRQAAEFSLYGSNLRADVDIAPTLWKAEVDAGQIEQVLNALVLNAREAMPHGGSIRIAARNVELEENTGALPAAGRYLEVSVSDRGPGVRETLMTKIFDPYFTTKPTATGLGLAISYSIVKKHGGLLLLENSSSEGSTFTFYLPATEGKVACADRPEAAPALPQPQQRVLVMDDEAAIRDLTSQLLSTLGYQVTAVPDGVEAIKTYERALRRGENFQAVILDATVRGGLGGIATIERLRGLDPQVNAIICSGYSDEAALSEFFAYGFRSALPKPFTRGDLADALRRSLATSDAA